MWYERRMMRFGLLAAAAALVPLASGPAVARDCRPREAPPGVRVAQPVGCKPQPATSKNEVKPPAVRSGRGPGWIDLGNGTEVRISGSVGVEGRTGGR
jgi:hypothetical protein